jgi:hypothetical protein
MIQRNTIVDREDRLAYRVLDGEAFLLTPEDSTLFCLNETGARIWQLIDGGRTAEDIAELIYAEYDIERDQACQEVVSFLQTLYERRLIVVGDEPSAVQARYEQTDAK